MRADPLARAIKIVDGYHLRLDDYNWTLIEEIPGKSRKGVPIMNYKETYHSNGWQIVRRIQELVGSKIDVSDFKTFLEQMNTLETRMVSHLETLTGQMEEIVKLSKEQQKKVYEEVQ